MCLVNVSFYENLLFSTLSLAASSAFIVLVACVARRPNDGVFAAVYLLLFSYPLVSVKVVNAFACHEIIYHNQSKTYLRSDYSEECYSSEWWSMALYSTSWIVLYVLGFPQIVIYKLQNYARNHAPTRLSFLADDYKRGMPMVLWEAEEMIRKLLLSVVGAFFSTKSEC
jgi:hypothetical protein